MLVPKEHRQGRQHQWFHLQSRYLAILKAQPKVLRFDVQPMIIECLEFTTTVVSRVKKGFEILKSGLPPFVP